MAPTLASVTALPTLGLRALTGGALDIPVQWVTVSELSDPTPFLEGGELLLTTGMRLTPEGADAYVARLVERGVAGLGFAVGIIHPTVPDKLTEAAERRGLALLEVPRPTPFIAIGKAMSQMLAAERYEDVTRAFRAQRELTRAALRGRRALITRLARELGGWVLLLDPDGAVRHAAPEVARRRAPEIAAELAVLRGSGPKGSGPAADSPAAPGAPRPTASPRRSPEVSGGPPASAMFSAAEDHVVVQAVGLGSRPRGYLAVGTGDPLPHVAHTILGAAVSLLILLSETPRSERELRSALAALLLGEPPGRGVPEPPLQVLACAGGTAVLEALEGDPAGAHCLAVPPGPRKKVCVVIAPIRLSAQVIELARGHGPVGAGDPGGPDDLGHGLVQAERALAAARRIPGGHGVLHHADLPGHGLLGLLDQEAARGYAESLLAPLRRQTPDLTESVRAYLAANGQGEAAARALGVHRHTLRQRVRRAAELLGRDLDDPAVRAELWIALAVTPPG